MSFDWSENDDRTFSSPQPIKCQYSFAPVYVNNTSKMALHPGCILHSNQSDFNEKNDNRTVNEANFLYRAEERACDCLFKGYAHNFVT